MIDYGLEFSLTHTEFERLLAKEQPASIVYEIETLRNQLKLIHNLTRRPSLVLYDLFGTPFQLLMVEKVDITNQGHIPNGVVKIHVNSFGASNTELMKSTTLFPGAYEDNVKSFKNLLKHMNAHSKGIIPSV